MVLRKLSLGVLFRRLRLDAGKGRFHVIVETTSLRQAGMLTLAKPELSPGYE
ncbi:MAG: hypothetical protein ACUVS3_08580 [Thermodesulfobacteriota bacterium]